MYHTPELEELFRKYLPGFTTRGKLHLEGKSRPLGARISREDIKKGKFLVAKTPRELVDEYNDLITIAAGYHDKFMIGAGIAAVCALAFMLYNNPLFLIISLIAGVKGINYYNVALAYYTDVADYENYPVIYPIQDMPKLAR